MNRAERMSRDETARKRRQTIKHIVSVRLQNFYDRMRRLRKRK